MGRFSPVIYLVLGMDYSIVHCRHLEYGRSIWLQLEYGIFMNDSTVRIDILSAITDHTYLSIFSHPKTPEMKAHAYLLVAHLP